MNKRTPGPWTQERHFQVYDDGRLPSVLEIVRNNEDGGSRLIARLFPIFEEAPTEETLANSRLIAAAPDLLAALEAMTAFAASFTANGCTRDEGAILDELRLSRPAAFSDAVHLSRAAIAKAKGEANAD